ncbi:ubiquitin-protein ligase molybdopterin-converting factor [Lentinula raphanica]|nr:ubiquitin-protein ligase molybdopterin-converting factor [Lentinula raphanica]KAJ3827897.1 ubiquitin-protein ligase molybdopterin-converting factor [Lentinula raphanica]KAJ3968573.1 ubiquitin-protein ligase molybdopterin-converting factor [Lentinula raphanica]
MDNFRSHQAQLIATALAASVATAGLLASYNAYTRRTKRKDLNEEVLQSIQSKGSSFNFQKYIGPQSLTDELSASNLSTSSENIYDEELVREQLARNYAFFGEEGMSKIRGGAVVVVGCGGVGSWAALMLARSGVSKIRLVDFDYVTLSSLNRHATASLEDVGTPKVKCVERTLKSVAKWLEVDARIEIWRKEEGGLLLEGADWVIDAIDNIQTKVDLLKYCSDNRIKVFASMGAGAKCDPTRVQISDISYTIYDPLARSVRRRLRLLGVSSGIPVVYSTEVPGDVKLLPLDEEEFKKGPVKELGVFDDFRVRILPVLGPLPSIFGLHIATYILCELAGKPIMNPLPIKNRRKLYERLWKDLLHREQKILGHTLNRIPLDEDDIGLIFEDIHRGRSVLPPHEVPTKPALVRWDLTRPLTLENCVVMEEKDTVKHVKAWHEWAEDKSMYSPAAVWGSEVEAVVAKRAKEIKKIQDWIA